MIWEREMPLFWEVVKLRRRKRGYILKKYWYIIGISLILFNSAKVMVSAETSIDYNGVVSDYNGVNLNAQEEQSQSEVKLGEDIYYNREQDRYIYIVPGTADRVSSSVMDGMVVQEPVSVEAGAEVKLILRCNGQKMDVDDMSAISDIGDYIVQVKNERGSVENLFSFKIIGESVNSLFEYRLPKNFAITSVLYQDEEIGSETNNVSFSDEGTYKVEYCCTRTMKRYTLNILVDRTPPVLALEGVENGRISGPVSLADLEPGAFISGTLNGEEIDLTGKQKLTVSGRYVINVSDTAGNSNTYKVTILIYMNTNSYVFLGIILAVIVTVVLYIYISRKKLKVR